MNKKNRFGGYKYGYIVDIKGFRELGKVRMRIEKYTWLGIWNWKGRRPRDSCKGVWGCGWGCHGARDPMQRPFSENDLYNTNTHSVTP